MGKSTPKDERIWIVVPGNDNDAGPKIIRKMMKQQTVRRVAVFTSEEIITATVWLPAMLTALVVGASALELLALSVGAKFVSRPSKGFRKLLTRFIQLVTGG